MAIDFNLPILTTLKTTFTTYIVDNIKAIATMNFVGATNIPDGCIRWDATNKKFEKYDLATTSWNDLADVYGISVQTLSGLTANPSNINTACTDNLATANEIMAVADLSNTGLYALTNTSNVGTVTLVSSAHTTIVTATLPAGKAGDIMFVNYTTWLSKGATGGTTVVELHTGPKFTITGTASNYFYQPANEIYVPTNTLICRYDADGVFTLTLRGLSQGSNISISPTLGRLAYGFLRKQS